MSIPFLNGLRVLDYTSLVAGPFCGKLLADVGADVIKIEPPEGDIARRRGPFPGDRPDAELSLTHHYVNVNKRGMTLSLDSEAGREVFRRLVKASDLLIEDTPPGTLEAMGLGYDDLERINPGLIMLSITPFGQTGPHSGWKAYNLNTIHAGGEGWLMPPGLAQRMFPDREPVKTGAYVGEYYCGVTAASAAIIGVFGRAASGRGQHIDMSKQEAHATLARIAIGMWAQSGFVETRATRDIPYGGCVPCKDGHAEVLFHIADNHWHAFTRMLGDPEWARDPKFATQEGRSQHGAEVNEYLFAWAKDRTKREIYDLGLKHGFPCGIFYAPSELPESEHEQARGFFVEPPQPVPSGRHDQDSRAPLPATRPSLRRRTVRSEARRAHRRGAGRGRGVHRRRDRAAARRWGLLAMGSFDPQPLSGVRIVDFTWAGVGPYCTFLCSIMGAEVIKPETAAHPTIFRGCGRRATRSGRKKEHAGSPWTSST